MQPQKDNTPPLVNFQITNPVTYLKIWWKKIISNEGIEIKIKARPLTTAFIVLFILGGSFSLGWVSRIPVINTILPAPTPTADPWRDSAYSGTLRKTSDGKFYLQVNTARAINLSIPVNINLDKYVGKRIFASGRYNTEIMVLVVTDATSLEILPIKPEVIPTSSPSPTSLPSPTPTASPISSPAESPITY